MLLIRCPWCGDRNETEFHYGGQAHVRHPEDPHALDDERWGRYLFVRDNPRGEFAERWSHSAGCRRWFTIRRDTATNDTATNAADSARDESGAGNASETRSDGPGDRGNIGGSGDIGDPGDRGGDIPEARKSVAP